MTVCEKHRRHRDYTRYELQAVLLQTAANFPVYRTYVRIEPGRQKNEYEAQVSNMDRRYVKQVVTDAGAENPDLDPELLHFLQQILLLEIPGLEGELAMRFQQFTSSAMAKGAEDTAFYRSR